MPCSRRKVLALSSTGAVGWAGCLSTGDDTADGADDDDQSDDLSDTDPDDQDDQDDQSGSDDPEENGSDEDGSAVDDPHPDDGEECDIETGEWAATGDPIEITTSIEEQTEDMEVHCAVAAAEAAIEVLDDELDLDVDELDGLSSVYSYDGEHHAIVDLTYTSSQGEVSHCHADVFDPDQFREALPATVDVTLEVDSEDESHECGFDITLRSRGEYED